MAGFTQHTGTTAVYDADHVDTDRIIPARFLSMVTRSGYGRLLFNDVRRQESCFPLDQADAEGASVLVVGTNFGCGSSREHAVWAIQQAGFVAVVARRDPDSPGYSDIFRSNAGNCGLLLVELPPESHRRLVEAGSGARVTVDLVRQVVVLDGHELPFDINPAVREQLLAGLDLVGTTLVHEGDIAQFEEKWDAFAPKV
ncbi:MAG: 3-isopropylmalate dehydratase small subunit [Fimbriimonadaceae bacterium]|nr:3-isopropylmalate dehydratase small subunit [Fimbriimonadaceae bacterium]